MGLAWALCSTLICAASAAHGLKKRSLSPAGAATALVVGVVHMLCGPRFGITLLMFYFTSSQLTKYKTKVKARIEEDFKEHGQRNSVQVLANSLGGCITALLARYWQLHDRRTMDGALVAFLAHYAACCSDTWSSELGILSRGQPLLITTGKVVPRGTNGGVSLLGTLAGAVGGLAMGLVFLATGWMDGTSASSGLPGSQLPLWGLLLGLLGTGLDSLLGATCQFSGYSQASQRVISSPGPGVRHVSGAHLLSNDGVNFTAAALTAALGGACAYAALP